MKVYKNANGSTYEVVKYNQSKAVAILLPKVPTFEQYPYMVAVGFNPYKDSWDGGIYDLTIEEAKEKMNDFQ